MSTTKLKPVRRRNIHASALITRKGGAHGKSAKALRAAAKRKLSEELEPGCTSPTKARGAVVCPLVN